MKKIDISSKTYPNKFAIVDDEDYERISQYKWRPDNNNQTFYAVRSFIDDGVYRIVLMHRQILGVNGDWKSTTRTATA